ncbi:phosphoribosylanthranilate isomerase [Gilvimarinus xylanilyticus]|uniref:N-(5'-phosphoribosyl)anthranilate isomerase n=1 Tax=Gilvimarinus xylanilyticus TaxID=2944139 RepID=A0A9X2KT61_9GAMM|nr:phosphoribosylanthranilate isomerase [Gilvimarinus xylanilyticus]
MTAARVKICGITRLDQAQHAVAAGADAIGLVFYPPSPRAVTIDNARAIARACGPFVTSVGLFVNAEPAQIEQVLARVPLQLLQFHGDEPAEFCEQFGRPYLKAIRMRPELDVVDAISRYPSASGILLDAYTPGVPGGTGETFDWARVPAAPSVPVVLAGGLTPANVAEAIIRTGCYGVDVSGGVEAAAGDKDPAKVENFIVNAQQAHAKGE